MIVGSIHASGRKYEWPSGYGPDDIGVAEVPEHICRQLAVPEPRPEPHIPPKPRRLATDGGYAATALKLELQAVARAPEGAIEHSPESPCIPRAEGQNDLGRADLPAVLSEGCRLRPEQAREARKWLVRVVARRAVEILKAQE